MTPDAEMSHCAQCGLARREFDSDPNDLAACEVYDDEGGYASFDTHSWTWDGKPETFQVAYEAAFTRAAP